MRAEFIPCKSWAEAKRLFPDWAAMMGKGRGGVWVFDGTAAYLEWHGQQQGAGVAHLTGEKEDGTTDLTHTDGPHLG